jgi:ABC-type branched-subunit amino acid transport system ATPase component
MAGYGGLDILRGVELHVEQGTVNCIVGPNGAGKSTVLAEDLRGRTLRREQREGAFDAHCRRQTTWPPCAR